MRCSGGLLLSMQSKSYDSPAGLPFLAGHALCTSLNTVSVIIMLLVLSFCSPPCLLFCQFHRTRVEARQGDYMFAYQASFWP